MFLSPIIAKNFIKLNNIGAKNLTHGISISRHIEIFNFRKSYFTLSMEVLIMTLKDFISEKSKNSSAKEENFGLGILGYYLDKLDNAKDYKIMSYASDTLYGILIGLRMSSYISENEFDLLKADLDKMTDCFFHRMEMELED